MKWMKFRIKTITQAEDIIISALYDIGLEGAQIDIAMVNKYYDLALMQPEVPAAVKEHYFALEHRADACMGCHSCESRCPFGVNIAERMKMTEELFGK